MGRALNELLILFNDCCINTFREFFSYSWDEKAANRGEDKPIKENDHAMDAVRYFVNTIVLKGKSSAYDNDVYSKGKGVKKNNYNAYKKGGGVF